MEIIIDISEDLYTYMQSRCNYQNKGDKGLSKFEEAGVAIKNGTPLPKGHGRLKDIDAIIDTLDSSDRDIYVKECLEEDTPTILPADTESED